MSVKIYSKKMEIGGESKKLVLINYSNNKKSSKLDLPIHHIQILDRSGSMCNDIDALIEDCKKTIEQMKQDDYYTIMWFSSPGKFRTILKGIKVSEMQNENSFKVLDSIKSVLGCTCFSESIEETEKIVNELYDLCPNFSITLFTDGQPVCPWSDNEEYKRVDNILSRIYPNIIAFNTIGYGNYCNEEQLESWSMFSEFGEFIHSSQIDEYHKIFDENTSRVRNLECNPIDLEINGKVFFYCTSNTIIQVRNHVKFNHSDKRKNQFILVLNENENISFTLNNEQYNTENSKDIQDNWIPGILYRMAYGEYCYGDRYKSLKILGSDLMDKHFVDSQIAAFTPDEISEYKKKLKKAAFRDSSEREVGTCNKNYIPSEDTPCLMDLLKCLVSSSENMYIPDENYKRVGRKVVDEFNMFHKDDSDCSCPISDIIFNEKKLNISIRFKVDGYVSINPKQAEKVGIDSNFHCSIFRTHTIVKDGFLNMNKIRVRIDSETYDLIDDFGNDIIEFVNYDGFSHEVILDLTKIPIINASYGNADIKKVFDLVTEENKLKADIKYMKFLLKNNPSIEERKYTPEQCSLLEEFGIKNGVYYGIKNNTPKVEDCDYYMSRTFEFSLKGFSKISPISVNDTGDYCVAKPTNGDIYLLKAFEDIPNSRKNIKEKDIVESLLYRAKTLLAETKAQICAIKIAKTLTGKWFDTSLLAETKKNGVYTYTDTCPFTGKELTMNIKTAYEKTYI